MVANQAISTVVEEAVKSRSRTYGTLLTDKNVVLQIGMQGPLTH